MRIRDLIKRYLPSYRTEERMTAKLDALRKDLREMFSLFGGKKEPPVPKT